MILYAVFNPQTCRWIRDAKDDTKIAVFDDWNKADQAAIAAGIRCGIAEVRMTAPLSCGVV